MNHGKKICTSFSLSGRSYSHQIFVLHAYGNGLHLYGFWFLEFYLCKVFENNLVGIFDLFPLADGIGCFSSSDVDLVILSEYSPISFVHLLKRLGLPRLVILVLEDIFLFGIHFFLSQNRDKSFAGIFAFIPFEKQLRAIVRISPARLFNFAQAQNLLLGSFPFLNIFLRNFLVLMIS